MTNPFATPYQEVDYVYTHVDPTDNKIIYVGRGTGSRAWMYTQPFRDRDHANYLVALTRDGYLPCDWVEIIDRGLSREAAIEIEKEAIIKFKPMFNKTQGLRLVKFTKEMMDRAIDLRSVGMSYFNIAKILNVSTMTVYRALNKQTPALEIKLEQK